MVEDVNSVTLAEALEHGIQAARHFDERLRTQESAERERRLTELAWRPRFADGSSTDRSLEIVQLHARISELNTYVRTIHESVGWRVIQRLRRLLGRSW